MEDQNRMTVCVIGFTGRLGSAMVKKLLHRGYTVHIATHDHANFDGVSEESGRWKFFQLDLLDYRSIVDAVKGCSGVFYSFEPTQEQSTNNESMVEIEVRAALNVLEACAQTETIRQIVFTSSVAAVILREDHKPVMDYDERSWSDTTFCRNLKLWNVLGKTLSEKTAWEMAMDRGVNMVSIVAGFLMESDAPTSYACLKEALMMYNNGVLVMVDVDFFIDSQIYVFEHESYGRYLCYNHLINTEEDAIKLGSPEIAVTTTLPCENLKRFQNKISNKKLKELMKDVPNDLKTGGFTSTILDESPSAMAVCN